MKIVPAAAAVAPAASEFSRAVSWSLGVTCVTLALAYGIWYAYSVFLVALLREFGWSRSVLAGAFSLFTLVSGAASTVLGWLGDRLGSRRLILAGGVILVGALCADSFISSPWQLYVGYGMVTALGVAMAGWTPAVLMVQRQFSERLGLALGIAGSGIGLGIFLVVPFCQVLIDGFGWRWAFRMLGAICAVWILPATWLAVRDTRSAVSVRADGSRRQARAAGPSTAAGGGLSLAAALATTPFWLIVGAMFLGNLSSQTLHVHQAVFLVDHGLTPLVAASVISVVGAASILGKTGGGWLSDQLRREGVYVLGMASMIGSVGVLWLVTLAPSAWLAYGYAVLFGLGYAVTASLMPAIVSDRFRGPNFGAIFGLSQVGSSLGSALGAWLAGRIFDATGSYAVPFTLAVVAAGAATLAVWIVRARPVPGPALNRTR